MPRVTPRLRGSAARTRRPGGIGTGRSSPSSLPSRRSRLGSGSSTGVGGMPERTEEELAQIERDAEEAKAGDEARGGGGADPRGRVGRTSRRRGRIARRGTGGVRRGGSTARPAVAALPRRGARRAQAALAGSVQSVGRRRARGEPKPSRGAGPGRRSRRPPEEEAEREAAEAAEGERGGGLLGGSKSPAPPSPEPPWRAVYRRQLSDDVAALLGDAIDRFEETLLPETEAEVAAECVESRRWRGGRRRRAGSTPRGATTATPATGPRSTRGGGRGRSRGGIAGRETLRPRERGAELGFRAGGLIPAERKLRLGAGGKNAKTQKKLDVGGGIERAREEE